MTTPATDAKAGYLDAFTAESRTQGRAPAWLAETRERAIRRFGEIGFPGAKDEAWKYTSVAPILRAPFHAALGGDDTPYDLGTVKGAIAGLRLASDDAVAVFVDGKFVPSLSRLDAFGRGATVRSLAADLRAGDPIAASRLGRVFDDGANGFAALNTAFAKDGAVVRIVDGRTAETTLHVVSFASRAAAPGISHLRNVVVCEPGSVLTLVEHHLGESGVHLSNAATEVVVEHGAVLRHVRVQDEGAGAYHVGRVEVHVAEAATYESHVVTLGARLSRTEVRVRLGGRHAEARLSGLYVINGENHADHHTWIDHEVAETKSYESYKGVLDGEARGVFTGHVLVRRDSQHIEARQSNKNLLLSEGAVVETRPQLEIFADDVQCSHGATIGRLDEAAMFYLRQRGLDGEAAKALLTWAFAGEMLAGLPDSSLRAALSDAVRARIAGVSQGAQGGEAGR